LIAFYRRRTGFAEVNGLQHADRVNGALHAHFQRVMSPRLP
jgi:hypothetical protein